MASGSSATATPGTAPGQTPDAADRVDSIKRVVGGLLAGLIAIFSFFGLSGSAVTEILRNSSWQPTAVMFLLAIATGAAVMSVFAKDGGYLGTTFVGVLLIAAFLPVLLVWGMNRPYPFEPVLWQPLWHHSIIPVVVGLACAIGIGLMVWDRPWKGEKAVRAAEAAAHAQAAATTARAKATAAQATADATGSDAAAAAARAAAGAGAGAGAAKAVALAHRANAEAQAIAINADADALKAKKQADTEAGRATRLNDRSIKVYCPRRWLRKRSWVQSISKLHGERKKFHIDGTGFYLLLALITLGWAAYAGVTLETRVQNLVLAPRLDMAYSLESTGLELKVTVSASQMATNQYVYIQAIGFSDPGQAAHSFDPCQPGDSTCQVLAVAYLSPAADGTMTTTLPFSPEGYKYARVIARACFNPSPPPVMVIVPSKTKTIDRPNCLAFTPSSAVIEMPTTTTTDPILPTG